MSDDLKRYCIWDFKMLPDDNEGPYCLTDFCREKAEAFLKRLKDWEEK